MDENKAVLITGTSSGIGKACALHLDKLGYKVYAGVRREEDADKLKSEGSEKLIPLILDVTDEESIVSAVDKIRQEKRKYANNETQKIRPPYWWYAHFGSRFIGKFGDH